MLTWLDNLLFCIKWPFPLLIIVAVMGLIAFGAYKLKKLSVSGSLAAAIEGIVILWGLRFEGFFLFFVFFFSCIAIEKYTRSVMKSVKKHEARDRASVLANGGMACIAALHFYNTGYNGALLMFGAVVAEATSDTWAGEIGRLSSKKPVSLRTMLPVKKGLSGGVTPLGFLAAFSAVVFIGVIWLFCFPVKNRMAAFAIICFSGFAGCIMDSFLGATCQALYEDAVTGELTEREKAPNGKDNKLVRGIEWMDNDAVNFVSNLFSALLALTMGAVLY